MRRASSNLALSAIYTHPQEETAMAILIEIRPGEGGDDARLLVKDQAVIYLRAAEHLHLAVEVVEDVRGGAG